MLHAVQFSAFVWISLQILSEDSFSVHCSFSVHFDNIEIVDYGKQCKVENRMTGIDHKTLLCSSLNEYTERVNVFSLFSEQT